jgi:NADPH:quinone reductase-like Zn-dependent oxidoreductase
VRAVVVTGDDVASLKLTQREIPLPAAGEVRVRMTAASLNYRDLLLINGRLKGADRPYMPLSCGCGIVDALGDGVSHVKAGDRVAPTFFMDWIDGPRDDRALRRALGGPAPGVACEFVCLPEHAMVKAPPFLSDLEVATLPCAALTAWSALFEVRNTRPGDVVLLQGTGGVSIAALQLANAAGATVIITSSSDAKLARARALGAHLTINYRSTPAWDQRTRELTDGLGADVVLDVIGSDTQAQSEAALRSGGTIAAIGLLAGRILEGARRADIDFHRIRVGSRAQFERMNRGIVANAIRPVVDQVFDLEDLGFALRVLESGSAFGKVGIRIG